jgi:hypothetical protein
MSPSLPFLRATPDNYPAHSEGCHPTTIDIQTVVEVEVLYLMLTCCHASRDVLVLADGGKG